MLAREFRFHGINALQYVYRQGRTFRSPTCLLKCAPNSRRKVSRVAVVVGKKVQKSAVARNRIRRRLYEVIRQAGIGEWGAYDLVFTVVDCKMESMSEKDIKDTIIGLLQTADVMEPVDK